MKFLDLFAGIGGFRLGMERAGHECVGFCLGALECIFADEKPKDYDWGATKDWLPKSKEFDDWVNFAIGMAQMEIAVYLIYGNPKEDKNGK